MTELATSRKHNNDLSDEDINELGEILKMKVAANNGVFSERLPLKTNGHFELGDKPHKLKSFFAHMRSGMPGENETELLYQLAHEVQKRCPSLRFAFDRDKEGRWITYTLSKRSKRKRIKVI